MVCSFSGSFGSLNIFGARLAAAILDQNFAAGCFEIIRPQRRDRLGCCAHKRNFRAELAQFRRQHPRHPQSHIAFRRPARCRPPETSVPPSWPIRRRDGRDRARCANPPSVCPACSSARDLAGRHRRGTRLREASLFGKAKREILLRVAIDQDAAQSLDRSWIKSSADPVGAINIAQQVREFIVRDRFLIFLEHIPFGGSCQRTARDFPLLAAAAGRWTRTERARPSGKSLRK